MPVVTSPSANGDHRIVTLSLVGFTAVCLWPLVNFLGDNIVNIVLGTYGSVLDVFVFVAFMWCTGFGLASIAGRRNQLYKARVLGILVLLIVLGFTFSAFRGGVESIFDMFGSITGVTRTAAVTVLVLLAATWFLTRFQPIRIGLTVIPLVALSLSLVNLATTLIEKTPWNLAAETAATAKNTPIKGLNNLPVLKLSGESVYYIILDAYTGQPGMELIGFDNRPFLNRMEKRGFYIAGDALSSYDQTTFTLMALLDLDYSVDDKTKSIRGRESTFPNRLEEGYVPPVVQIFRQAGYKNIRISNDWGQCNETIFDECHMEAVIPHSLATFLEPTFIPFAVFYVREKMALTVLISLLPDIFKKQPVFVFGHNFQPHNPYSHFADCSRRKEAVNLNDDNDEAAYLDVVKCVNKKVEVLVDRILEKDPTAIIVLQADHGARFRINGEVQWADRERWKGKISREDAVDAASILNMIRAPEACQPWLKPNLSDINTMRFVISCLQRRRPEYLKVKNFTHVVDPETQLYHLIHFFPPALGNN